MKPLTKTEWVILRLWCAGHRAKAVAHELGIEYRTIEFHVRNIKDKLLGKRSTHSAAALGMVAERLGLLEGVKA